MSIWGKVGKGWDEVYETIDKLYGEGTLRASITKEPASAWGKAMGILGGFALGLGLDAFDIVSQDSSFA